MKEVFIHYIIQEDKVAETIARVQDFFKSLYKNPVRGVSYCSYLLGSNVLILVTRFEDNTANLEALESLEFKDLMRYLSVRLEEAPIKNDVKKIGFYSTIEKETLNEFQ